MLYCINPNCENRQNQDDQEHCQACGTQLLINNQYRLIQPLRDLEIAAPTEIFEVTSWGITKVLKVLKQNNPKFVELFRREAQVLRQLNHPGIPKVDVSFVFSSPCCRQKLYCLVMEKVEGQNLAQWIRQHQRISQEQAVIWLKQLADILDQVHQYNLFHRDIKPANIMVKPNGQLVLIDFGTVREMTTTYVGKLEDADITRVFSQGYTAPEQIHGVAVQGSDFFALGRTFVHLLTGKHPAKLENPMTGELFWRHCAPEVERWFADLIDDMMARSPHERPQNPQVILQRLIEDKFSEVTQFINDENPTAVYDPDADIAVAGHTTGIRKWRRWLQPWLHRRRLVSTVVCVGAIATVGVMALRTQGMLQGWELQAYDQLLRSRPEEGPDRRLLVVAVTDDDLHLPQQKERQGSLSDLALAQLLAKLESYKPRAIGLDIFRDFPTQADQRALKRRLRQSDRFYSICHVGEVGGKDRGIANSPDVPLQQQGFSNVVPDPDGVLRRQLLSMDVPPTSVCSAGVGLSMQLALRYLRDEGIKPKFNQDNWQLGKVVLNRLIAPQAGYQKADTWGNQIMLNYRSYRSVAEIADIVTLADVLNNKIKPQLVQNRVVLIGVMTRTSGDRFPTPYSWGRSTFQEIPGVIAHAQMVSQILSAVLNDRPLIVAWPKWVEVLWVWVWGVIGAYVFWRWRYNRLVAVLGGAIALGVLYGLSLWLLVWGFWVPLVPSSLTLLLGGGSMLILSQTQLAKRQ